MSLGCFNRTVRAGIDFLHCRGSHPMVPLWATTRVGPFLSLWGWKKDVEVEDRERREEKLVEVEVEEWEDKKNVRVEDKEERQEEQD